MDFRVLPIEIQQRILRHMDFRSFLKTVVTSRAMLEITKHYQDKQWKVAVTKESIGRGYSFSPPAGSAALEDIEILRMLFYAANTFEPHQHGQSPEVSSTSHPSLNLCYEDLDPDRTFKLQKSAGEFGLTMEKLRPKLEVLAWINRHIQRLDAKITVPPSEYLGLKQAHLTLHISGFYDQEYTENLVDEWLRGEREIKKVSTEYFSGRNVGPSLPGSPARFEPHPQIIVRHNFGVQTFVEHWYRIARDDGELLIVKFRRTVNTVDLCSPFQACAGSDNGRCRTFAYGTA